MKKLNKEIDYKNLEKDINNILNFFNKLETLDLEKADLNDLEKESKDLQELLKNKYSDLIENPPQDLDTEE